MTRTKVGIREKLKSCGAVVGTEGSFIDCCKYFRHGSGRNHGVNSGSHIVEKRKFSQANTDFDVGFLNAGAKPKEVVDDSKGKVEKDRAKTQKFYLVGKSGQCDAQRKYTKSLQIENSAMYAAVSTKSCSC